MSRSAGGLPTIAGFEEEEARGIELTPMVDVMMSLLIIFMVITPTLTTFGARLPQARHVLDQDLEDGIVVGVDASGEVRIGETPVPVAALEAELRALYEARPGDHVLYLEADRDASYARVLDVIDAARAAGVRTVGAIAEVPP